ncbi:unnamed protein product [Absidia cylindrospora]
MRSEYQDWCSHAGLAKVPSSTNLTDTSNDLFNCDILWQDEFKFSLVSVFLMVNIYLYWATCIYSYSHKLAAVELWERGMLTGQVEGIAPFFQGLPGPMTAPDQPNVIVLQNEKPSRHTKKSKPSSSSSSTTGGVLSSLKQWKKSTTTKKKASVDPSGSIHPYLPAPSTSPSITSPEPTHPPSYPLDFKIGVNGNVIELK